MLLNMLMLMLNLMFFLVNLLFVMNCGAFAEDLVPVASSFSRYSIVHPFLQHARNKRNIHTTRDENGAHHSEVTMTMVIEGEEYILDLRMNQDLITDNHVLTYQKNGETVMHTPTKKEIELCEYSGSVRGKPNSWVALSTCEGVQGVVFDGVNMRYIEPTPTQGGQINSKHYVYNHADLTRNYKCGYVSSLMNKSDYVHSDEIMDNRKNGRYKRHVPSNNQVHIPYNANNKSRYVELVLVVDNGEYKANKIDLHIVHRRMKTLANIINSIYSPLNIFIALVGVEVWTDGDQIQLEPDGDRTLNNFLEYRQKVLVKKIPHDNAHLLTRQKFQFGIIGKALRSSMCTYNFSGGVENIHTTVLGEFATTIAHEMGHNFGMEHDTDDECKCSDKKCIMDPASTTFTPIHWSSCSMNALALSFGNGLDSCLRNKPRRLFSSPTCGNGFVESNEQCDCGTVTDVGFYNPCHACCDPGTCMLRSNATCGSGMCCDLQTCRPKSAGTVCRSADRECDLPEYCTGHSEYCPDDVYKMDTTPCGKGNQSAYCMYGKCRSHTDQCRVLWGVTGQNGHHFCYNANQKGDKYGHCGYDHVRNNYIKCKKENVLCGVLKCFHKTNEPQVSEKQYYPTQIIINDRVQQCDNVAVNVIYKDIDPAMVPDGAKCGHDMMCLNQKCVSVSAEKMKIVNIDSSVCPSDCSGHGVCNSAGHCHCEPGYGPPLCAGSGPGGSYESGPPNPTSSQIFNIIMPCIGILAILAIILFIFLMCYFRSERLLCCCEIMQKFKKSHDYATANSNII